MQCPPAQLGPRDVLRDPKESSPYEADEHEIWVTCSVGTASSDYIDGLDGWTLESDEGIGKRLRLERALNLSWVCGRAATKRFPSRSLGPVCLFAGMTASALFGNLAGTA
jgi:hypothetical protein